MDKRVTVVDVPLGKCFIYETPDGVIVGGFIIENLFLKKDDTSYYVEYPMINACVNHTMLNHDEEYIAFKNESTININPDDVLTVVYCLDLPNNYTIKLQLPPEIDPNFFGDMMDDIFIRDKVSSCSDRTTWFIVSICGSSVPISVSILNNDNTVTVETLTIPSYDCDKQSDDWKNYITALKRLNIKRVKNFRF